MIRPKIKVFRVDLAICLLVPLLILVLVSLIGYGVVGSEKKRVLQVMAMLDEVPLLETQLAAAQKVLVHFRMINGSKENAEWSHRVTREALARGVEVKSINTDKVHTQSVVSCNDYRVLVSGEGRLDAVLDWLDELDQPARCFKVSSLKMRAVKVVPRFLYEVEGVLNARSIAQHSQLGNATEGLIEGALVRLRALVGVANTLVRTKRQKLDTSRVEARERMHKDELRPVVKLTPMAVKLTGIVKDGKKPMALTDRGVLGEGDALGGGRVFRIGADHIVIENVAGQQEVIQLYHEGATP